MNGLSSKSLQWTAKTFFGNEGEMSDVLLKNVIFWGTIGKSVFISNIAYLIHN